MVILTLISAMPEFHTESSGCVQSTFSWNILTTVIVNANIPEVIIMQSTYYKDIPSLLINI